MENGVDRDGVPMFCDEELSEINGLKLEKDYVQVTCGCTSHRYGDAVGKLRVFRNGDLEISCECTPGCQEDKLTPAAFEIHAERESAPKWKNSVWIIAKGEKVPVTKTALLKYYNKALKKANASSKSNKGKSCHRDEFLTCSKCNKVRRFHLTTKEECRIHHDVSADANWKCADIPYDKISCDNDEERASRKVYKGCLRAATCKGCTSCVCFVCVVDSCWSV